MSAIFQFYLPKYSDILLKQKRLLGHESPLNSGRFRYSECLLPCRLCTRRLAPYVKSIFKVTLCVSELDVCFTEPSSFQVTQRKKYCYVILDNIFIYFWKKWKGKYKLVSLLYLKTIPKLIVFLSSIVLFPLLLNKITLSGVYCPL